MEIAKQTKVIFLLSIRGHLKIACSIFELFWTPTLPLCNSLCHLPQKIRVKVQDPPPPLQQALLFSKTIQPFLFQTTCMSDYESSEGLHYICFCDPPNQVSLH